MADWTGFHKQFEGDRNHAREDKQRAIQEQRLVQDKGPSLWDELWREAEAAAMGCSLMFTAPNHVTDVNVFEIIYDREGERRAVTGTLDGRAHSVTISLDRLNRSWKQKLIMVANNANQVVFSHDRDFPTPEDVVTEILRQLL